MITGCQFCEGQITVTNTRFPGYCSPECRDADSTRAPEAPSSEDYEGDSMTPRDDPKADAMPDRTEQPATKDRPGGRNFFPDPGERRG